MQQNRNAQSPSTIIQQIMKLTTERHEGENDFEQARKVAFRTFECTPDPDDETEQTADQQNKRFFNNVIPKLKAISNTPINQLLKNIGFVVQKIIKKKRFCELFDLIYVPQGFDQIGSCRVYMVAFHRDGPITINPRSYEKDNDSFYIGYYFSMPPLENGEPILYKLTTQQADITVRIENCTYMNETFFYDDCQIVPIAKANSSSRLFIKLSNEPFKGMPFIWFVVFAVTFKPDFTFAFHDRCPLTTDQYFTALLTRECPVCRQRISSSMTKVVQTPKKAPTFNQIPQIPMQMISMFGIQRPPPIVTMVPGAALKAQQQQQTFAQMQVMSSGMGSSRMSPISVSPLSPMQQPTPKMAPIGPVPTPVIPITTPPVQRAQPKEATSMDYDNMWKGVVALGLGNGDNDNVEWTKGLGSKENDDACDIELPPYMFSNDGYIDWTLNF